MNANEKDAFRKVSFEMEDYLNNLEVVTTILHKYVDAFEEKNVLIG